MTPNLNIRSFSNDQYILDKVFYSNFYKLKAFKENQVVLDLGAHAGFFSFTSITLGAKKVYAFEPHPDNFKALIKNVDEFGSERITPYSLGVYTENTVIKFAPAELLETSYYDYANIRIEEATTPTYRIPCFSLDYILKNIIKEDIDLLKISLGYGELDILSASSLLETRVKNICMGIGENKEKVLEFVSKMKTRDFPDYFLQRVPEEEDQYILLFSKGKCSEYFTI